jgi:hypothetical protein
MGKHLPWSPEERKRGGNCGHEPLSWLLWEIISESMVRRISLNNFSSLWDIGVLHSCLVSSPGMIGETDYRDLI